MLEELDEGMDSLVSEGGVGGNFEVSAVKGWIGLANPNPDPRP